MCPPPPHHPVPATGRQRYPWGASCRFGGTWEGDRGEREGVLPCVAVPSRKKPRMAAPWCWALLTWFHPVHCSSRQPRTRGDVARCSASLWHRPHAGHNNPHCHDGLHHRPCFPNNTEPLPGNRRGGKTYIKLFVTAELLHGFLFSKEKGGWGRGGKTQTPYSMPKYPLRDRSAKKKKRTKGKAFKAVFVQEAPRLSGADKAVQRGTESPASRGEVFPSPQEPGDVQISQAGLTAAASQSFHT